MASAVQEVIAGSTYVDAAARWGIPKTTIRLHVISAKRPEGERVYSGALDDATERDMVEWFLGQYKGGWAPTGLQITKRAQELLVDMGDPRTLDDECWGRRFMSRHPELQGQTLRKRQRAGRLGEEQEREVLEWALQHRPPPTFQGIIDRATEIRVAAGDNTPLTHYWAVRFTRQYPEAQGNVTLDDAQKRALTAWIWSRHEAGSPASLDQIQRRAQATLDAVGNKRPLAATWARGFIERYPELPPPAQVAVTKLDQHQETALTSWIQAQCLGEPPTIHQIHDRALELLAWAGEKTPFGPQWDDCDWVEGFLLRYPEVARRRDMAIAAGQRANYPRSRG